MADHIGQRFGDYHLFQLLGRGEFAEVYLGKHVKLEALAAIKVFQCQLEEQTIEKFRLEARIITHLVHPHIARILEFGVEKNTPYLVMNYIAAGSLRQLHPKGSRLPLATIVSYVNQISLALHYTHEQQIIHRHVKPANFLVGNANKILLSDFGIAIVEQHSSSQDPLDMTYTAPELIAARPHPRLVSDQYSLGIVVYEWLTGEPPFQGAAPELAIKQRALPPPPLREKFPAIPPAVETVVMKALEKRWDQRFADVQAFATALEQASQLEMVPTIENAPTVYAIPVPQAFEATVAVQMPVQPSQKPAEAVIATNTRASRGISRRVIMSALVGLVAVGAVGGGVVWFSRRTTLSTSTAISVTPTPVRPKLPASAPMFGFNPAHTSFNANEYTLSPTNVAHLTPYWSTSTGDSINSTPAVVGNVVYVGSNDTKVYACDATTGNILWTVATGGAITASPAVANGVVYIGSADHNLYALKAETGKTLWTMPANDAFLSSPTVVNGVVYAGSADHKLYALNAATGSILWTVTTHDSIQAAPSVIDGVVYIGSNDHTLYACDDFTGTVLWTASTGDSILAAPALANGIAYVGSADHNVYALDARTGNVLWTVATRDRIASGCAVADGVVYVGSEDHTLYACHATTGKVLWNLSTGDQIDATPMVANGVVYIGSGDHKLYACHATTGKVLWTASTKDRIISSPVVVNGVVYIGSLDHTLYAFHLPS